MAEAVANALRHSFSGYDLKSGAFLVIPASTQNKNEKRFKLFCQLVSSKTGLSNGFEGIVINNDRGALKGKINADKTSNLFFNTDSFRSKTVFLFDDVMTTGSSFVQNAKELKRRGAKTVIGVCLTITVNDKSKVNFSYSMEDEYSKVGVTTS